MTLESTITWLVDREQLRELLARGAQAQDVHDWEGLAACYEPDAIYVHPGGQIEGAEAIVARSRAALEQLDSSQHLIGSITLRIDGDVAHAVCHFHAEHVRADAEGGPIYTIGGTYTDTFVRCGDSWRIARRVQTYSFRSGNRDVVRR